MKQQIDLSVVIPTYRRPHLLKRCLESLREQTYPLDRFEVVIVSDGEDAETENLLKPLLLECSMPLVRYRSLPEKAGPAAARNAGWQLSEAMLVLFTDDDCIPDSQWIESYVRASYLNKEHVHICFTGQVQVPVSEFPTDYEKNIAHLSTAEFITANCALSRSTLILLNGFDASFPIAWREDSDIQFRLLGAGIPILHVPDAIICHPVRKAVWGISLYEQQKSMFNALLYKKHRNMYKKRIASAPVWRYYLIIIMSVASVAAFAVGYTKLSVLFFVMWAFFIAGFIRLRLKDTSKSLSHCAEMVITSVAIPYLSVYWTLRGAWRYRVFFL